MKKTLYVETTTAVLETPDEGISLAWPDGLPVLTGDQVVLRELRASDAGALVALVSSEEVARFISRPPQTEEGFERFIAGTARLRRAGTAACYAVTLKGFDTAIGLIQLRELEGPMQTAEWGFALGSPFWGTGVFQEAAALFLDFAFGTIGVHRLEARAAARNGRGTSVLRKLGAVEEGLLRRALKRNGEYLDQVLYAIVDDDWRASAASRMLPQTPHVHWQTAHVH